MVCFGCFFSSFLVLSSSSLLLKEKIFSPFSLSLFTEKILQKRKKKVRLKSIRRRRKRRRREILVAFTVESFYLLAFRILSSSSCCCVGFFCRRVLISIAFSRAATHHWRRTFARGKRGLAIFFIRTLGARKKRGWCFGGRRERVDADFEL